MRAHATACARSAKLAFGEDAGATTVMRGIERRRSEYSAVEKAQIVLKRMFDRRIIHHCAFDPAAVINDPLEVFWCKLQANRLRIDDGVKRATISDVKFNRADP